MIDRTNKLPLKQQCQILARSTAYCQPPPESADELALNFCIEAVQDAMNRYGKPEVFNIPLCQDICPKSLN